MKAIILAAGRGERMRPLTDTCPKPLLKVHGIPLIEHHVKNLAKAGVDHIVINHAWLGEKIEEHLQCGEQFGVSIKYSREGSQALETAGGIIKALPLLTSDNSDEPFLVVNGDVFTDFDFKTVGDLSDDSVGKIWLVENPEHNLKGDFCLVNGKIKNKQELVNNQRFTFTGISLFRPSFFKRLPTDNILPLGPLLRELADKDQLDGDIISAHWTDVGTPERLAQLNKND